MEMEMTTSLADDASVVAAVLGGQTESFAVLVDRYSPRLLGLAFHLCGDYDTAVDLTQETLLEAFNGLRKLKDPTAFAAWAAGILRNKYRNLGRNQPVPTISLNQLMDAGYDPPAQHAGPDVTDEDLQLALSCIESLPPQYREVLLLRYADELSYKEIAEMQDLPVSTVTTRLNYARKLVLENARKEGLR